MRIKEEKCILNSYKKSILINSLYNGYINYGVYSNDYNEIENKFIKYIILEENDSKINVNNIIYIYDIKNEKKQIKVKVIDKIVFDNIENLLNSNIYLSKKDSIAQFSNFEKNNVFNKKILLIKFQISNK